LEAASRTRDEIAQTSLGDGQVGLNLIILSERIVRERLDEDVPVEGTFAAVGVKADEVERWLLRLLVDSEIALAKDLGRSELLEAVDAEKVAFALARHHVVNVKLVEATRTLHPRS
jgi:hypothetical protein